MLRCKCSCLSAHEVPSSCIAWSLKEHYSKRYQIDMVDCARHVICSWAALTFVYRLAMFQSVSPAPYALPTASSGATVRPISR